jgi:hypothetical protein
MPDEKPEKKDGVTNGADTAASPRPPSADADHGRPFRGEPAAASPAAASPAKKEPKSAPPKKTEIPSHLLKELRAGRVVVFIGSGFTAPAGFPTWKSLLLGISDRAFAEGKVEASTVELVKDLLRAPRPAAHEYDQAAQVLDDELKTECHGFQEELVRHLRALLHPKAMPLPASVERRIQTIRELPFRAILTTNYNPLLRGITPFDARAAAVYRRILRGEAQSGVDAGEASLRESDNRGVAFSTGEELKYAEDCAPVVQCHGNLHDPASVVLTHEGYRQLLYKCPNYHTFMKACLAQYTVLYLGFSFTDAYLNELNSEVLSMIGPNGPPIAYTIMADKSERECDFNRKHRGMHTLSWSMAEEGFDGFDRILEDLAHAAAAAPEEEKKLVA